MDTNKLIIYGAAAYIAYSVIKRRGLAISGGVNVGGVNRGMPITKAQENQINAQTALNLAYGIKNLVTGWGGSGGSVPTSQSLAPNESIVTSNDIATDGQDFWAANPYAADSY